MVLAHEDDTDDNSNVHPCWYGRIISMFHACVKHTRPGIDSQQIFYQSDGLVAVSFVVRVSRRSLARIGFIDSSNAFDFVDSREVI
ncbi:hypothetical protein PILCRDRAFT_776423 [Piloderma croceum F 1598]|uniref:Uncharacterized protein n=1 Tax=Piloderma croceum (strain F 1598) TaxID=765440 RepID=A0A0C3G088_PILCF|nr:hypothetical protein PILCRDRAFT_776423 [Piloderma croceum F 1598]